MVSWVGMIRKSMFVFSPIIRIVHYIHDGTRRMPLGDSPVDSAFEQK